MLIKSLRTEIAILAFTSILSVSTLILWFAIDSYETLYQQTASNDLNGLSENVAIDLIASIDEQDNFKIDSTLLQLEQYDNVRFAAVFDENGSILNDYLGNALRRNKTPDEIIALPQINYQDYFQYPLGMTKVGDIILAKKRIGDIQSSLGYLIIANDLSEPLLVSKKNLLWSILPWAILTIFANIVLIIVFQNRTLKPLIQLATFLRKVKDTRNYSLVATVNGKREISVVTDGLNSMMKEINTEIEKNKQQNHLLTEQQEEMEKLANFDILTGLPNRQFFMQRLETALVKAKTMHSDAVLMFFDLDGFKLVNDSFGHETGDRLLRAIARKIVDIIGPEHVVARLGGDEFLVLLEGEYTDDYLQETAGRFIKGISEPIDIEQWDLQVGTSVGIARASASDFNVTELIANADIAMYRAKADGRHRFTLFTQGMIEISRRKLKIANAINKALSANEFTLFYQPKVNVHQEIIGYEALVRWSNDELGHISPAEFIPIAEQSGKITQITEWVIEQAFKDSQSIFAVRDSITIALNLSIHDLKNPSLINIIYRLMLQYKVKPQQIEFEITESAYLDNFEGANLFIEEIRNMGCSIALDDFGTGYSSLSYLTQIKIDTLKIDKQFVDQIGVSQRSTLVTKTIIEMAKHLDLQVCAEGVETIEQSQLLLDSGCHILQGYYFGKPEPLEIILEKLQ